MPRRRRCDGAVEIGAVGGQCRPARFWCSAASSSARRLTPPSVRAPALSFSTRLSAWSCSGNSSPSLISARSGNSSGAASSSSRMRVAQFRDAGGRGFGQRLGAGAFLARGGQRRHWRPSACLSASASRVLTAARASAASLRRASAPAIASSRASRFGAIRRGTVVELREFGPHLFAAAVESARCRAAASRRPCQRFLSAIARGVRGGVDVRGEDCPAPRGLLPPLRARRRPGCVPRPRSRSAHHRRVRRAPVRLRRSP